MSCLALLVLGLQSGEYGRENCHPAEFKTQRQRRRSWGPKTPFKHLKYSYFLLKMVTNTHARYIQLRQRIPAQLSLFPYECALALFHSLCLLELTALGRMDGCIFILLSGEGTKRGLSDIVQISRGTSVVWSWDFVRHAQKKQWLFYSRSLHLH